MAVAFDAVGGGAAGVSPSWSHTATGSDLVGIVVHSSCTGAYATAASWGGQAMSLWRSGVTVDNTYAFYVTVWVIFGPPTGAQTVSVTCASGTIYDGANSITYTGCGGIADSPQGTSTGTGAKSLALTSATGHLAVFAFLGGGAYAPGAWTSLSGTQRYNAVPGAGNDANRLLYMDEAGAASVTGSATEASGSGAEIAVLYGFDLLPTGSGSVGAVACGPGNHSTGAAISWTSYLATTSPATVAVVGVVISESTGAANTSCAVTYGGTTMTQAGLVHNGTTNSGSDVGIYWLANPPAGAQTVTVTPGGTSTKTQCIGSSVVYRGTGQVANYGAAATTGKTVTSAAGEMAFCVTGNGAALSVPTKIGRYLYGASVTGVGDYCSIQDAIGAASVVFANTGTASTPESLGLSLPPITAWTADATLEVTASPTAAATYGANVDSTQQVTATPTSNVTCATAADAAQAVTATDTAATLRNANVDVTQDITTTITSVGTAGLQGDSSQESTTTNTAVAQRIANIDVAQEVNATGTADGDVAAGVIYADSTLEVTATPTAAIQVSNFAVSMWSQPMGTDDVQVNVTIGTCTSDDDWLQIYLRTNDSQQVFAWMKSGSPDNNWVIATASGTILASTVESTAESGTVTQTYTTGDVLSFQAIGPIYKILKNGVEQVSWTDTGYASYPYVDSSHRMVGIAYASPNAYDGIDSWSADDLTVADSTLEITATTTAERMSFNAFTADSTLEVTASVLGNAIWETTSDVAQEITAAYTAVATWSALVDASQAITATLTGDGAVEHAGTHEADATLSITAGPIGTGSLGAVGNAPLAITATDTATAIRNANVDSVQPITTTVNANAILAMHADAAQPVTATLSALGSYGAVANVVQPITATDTANVIWGLKANVAQAITATDTASALRLVNTDSTVSITATQSSTTTWQLIANSAQAVTATQTGAALRATSVDAIQAITATLSSQIGLTVVVDASQGITATLFGTATRGAVADSLLGVTATVIVFYGILADASLVIGIPAGLPYELPFILDAPGGFPTAYMTWSGPADTSQTITATDTTETVVGLHGNVSQAITATLVTGTYNQWLANAILSLTATPSGVASKNASAASAMLITATDTAAVLRLVNVNSTMLVTATNPADIRYDAFADSPLVVTVSPYRTGTWMRMVQQASASLTVTATLLRQISLGAPANSTLGLTATLDAAGFYGAIADVFMPITTGVSSSASRWQSLDTAQVITFSPTGVAAWSGVIDTSLEIASTSTGLVTWSTYADVSQVITVNSYVLWAGHAFFFDASLGITVPLSAAANSGATALSSMPITASTNGIASQWQQMNASQSITISPSGVFSRRQAADAAQLITAGPTATSLRKANVTSDLLITALPVGGIGYNYLGNVYLRITAPLITTMGRDSVILSTLPIVVSPNGNGSRGQDTDVSQSITASTNGNGSRGQRMNILLPITASPTDISTNQGQLLDVAQLVTADTPTDTIWQTSGDASLATTATPTSAGALDISVDASQVITESPVALVNWDIHADSPLALAVVFTGDIVGAITGNFFYFYVT